MRKFWLAGILLYTLRLSAQNISLPVPWGTEAFAQNATVMMIKFNPGTGNAERAAIIPSQYCFPLDTVQNDVAYYYAFVQLRAGLSTREISDLAKTLASHSETAYASPMFAGSDGTLYAPTNKIFVKLKSPSAYIDLGNYLDTKYPGNTVRIQAQPFNPLDFLLYLPLKNTQEVFGIAQDLYAQGFFDWVEPDFVLIAHPVTDDPYYDYQWSLENTGSDDQYNGVPGDDIDANCAWGYTQGAGSRVAILDEGVDLSHPDLEDNLLPGRDEVFIGGASATNTMGGPKVGSDDAHGTNCAGIVCAKADNGIGVSGVAPQSKVIPVHIAYENGMGGWTLEFGWVSDAIYWSCDSAGADILSNSYQLGIEPMIIDDAIDYAVTSGRGGLGALFVAAAGNNNSSTMVYPGKYDNSIGVGATSMCDERKSFTSCDGENFWGSNYGSKLDVSAPGVKIPSTDISGTHGYSTTDYFLTFNGTSSATPHVAAVLALILSLDPSLNYSDARYDLESTCEKVGGYTYNTTAGHPNGTWTNELGYGRVNACLALEAVYDNLSQPDLVSAINSVSSDTVHPAETVHMDYNIENSGITDATTTFTNDISLSDDCSPGGSDLDVYSFTSDGLASSATDSYSDVLTIPENASQGWKNLLLFPDSYNDITEHIESNNISCIPVFVQCQFSPNGTEAVYGTDAVTDSILITSTSACHWTVSPGPPAWVSILHGFGTGNGYFSYSLSENTDFTTRSYICHYGNATYTITQEGRSTAVDDATATIRIFPNPADAFIDVSVSSGLLSGDLHAEIMNAEGQQVFNGFFAPASDFRIPTAGLPQGMYFLRITCGPDAVSRAFVKR